MFTMGHHSHPPNSEPTTELGIYCLTDSLRTGKTEGLSPVNKPPRHTHMEGKADKRGCSGSHALSTYTVRTAPSAALQEGGFGNTVSFLTLTTQALL